MILLTDEEIEKLVNEIREMDLVPDPRYVGDIIAKAQLKKDVKYILDYGEDMFLEECIKEFGNYEALLEETK